jgi:hypothetical protein
MKHQINSKVNVILSLDEKKRLGIGNDPKNPCIVTGHYENGVDGHYIKDSEGKSFAIADKYNALSIIE